VIAEQNVATGAEARARSAKLARTLVYIGVAVILIVRRCRPRAARGGWK